MESKVVLKMGYTSRRLEVLKKIPGPPQAKVAMAVVMGGYWYFCEDYKQQACEQFIESIKKDFAKLINKQELQVPVSSNDEVSNFAIGSVQ